MSQSYAFHIPYAIAPKNRAMAVPDPSQYDEDHTGQKWVEGVGWMIDRPHYTTDDVPQWLRIDNGR